MYCSTDIIAVSESLKSRLVELNLANQSKIKVLGYGSSMESILKNLIKI